MEQWGFFTKIQKQHRISDAASAIYWSPPIYNESTIFIVAKSYGKGKCVAN